MEEDQLLADRGVEVVNVPSDGEEGTGVVPPLVQPNRERAVIPVSLGGAEAESYGGSGAARSLVWPQLDEPGKARFVLRDRREQEL